MSYIWNDEGNYDEEIKDGTTGVNMSGLDFAEFSAGLVHAALRAPRLLQGC